MGEFRHEVLVDGKTETLPVMGCDLEAVPQAHGDLRKNDSAVHNTDDYRFAELALAEAETELSGLRARLAETQRSVISLLAQVQDIEPDPACCFELANLELTLVAGQRDLARLGDHLIGLRKLERHIDRLLDQAQVAILAN